MAPLALMRLRGFDPVRTRLPAAEPLERGLRSAGRSSCEQVQFKVIAKHGALTLEEVLAGRGV
jgi:hypothetical protein